MNLNKKSLLVACVLAAMSTTAFAATQSTSSTTVTNHDTPTSTSIELHVNNILHQLLLKLFLRLKSHLLNPVVRL